MCTAVHTSFKKTCLLERVTSQRRYERGKSQRKYRREQKRGQRHAEEEKVTNANKGKWDKGELEREAEKGDRWKWKWVIKHVMLYMYLHTVCNNKVVHPAQGLFSVVYVCSLSQYFYLSVAIHPTFFLFSFINLFLCCLSSYPPRNLPDRCFFVNETVKRNVVNAGFTFRLRAG